MRSGVYIAPRELTGQIKPHVGGEEGREEAGIERKRGTAGEESERISRPTQKPTLLMTLSAVISGCYLSWLPGGPPTSNHEPAHAVPLSLSLFLARLLCPPLLSLLPHSCTIRIMESGDLFRRVAFKPRYYLYISLIYGPQ